MHVILSREINQPTVKPAALSDTELQSACEKARELLLDLITERDFRKANDSGAKPVSAERGEGW